MDHERFHMPKNKRQMDAVSHGPESRDAGRVEPYELFQRAQEALQRAVAPSSKFRVGAALLAEDGRIFTGCNIESPTYLGICAERVALFKGLSEGTRTYRTMMIVCEEQAFCLPCGSCRQLLWEFAPSIEIMVQDESGAFQSYRVQSLLPEPFLREKRNRP